MLLAYLSIFQGIPYIVAVIGISLLLSLIFQDRSSIARSILFSFGFWLAPLFYIIYIALVHQLSIEILDALFVELVIFIIFQMLFSRLFSILSDSDSININLMMKWLKLGITIIIVLASPLLFQGKFGIFSDTSRNDYLVDSRWYLYFIYASVLTQSVMVPIVAAILNHEKRWNRLVAFYLITISILSLLGGSKGGGFLSCIAIFSLIRLRGLREYFKLFWGPLVGITAIVSLSIFTLGNFLALSSLQVIALLFSRVFLNNDARALAIDFAGSSTLSGASLFSESFRSYATLLGSPPVYPPLGQYLYTQAFQTEGFVGANTSSTALIILYGSEVEKLIFSAGICVIAFGLYMFALKRSRYSIMRIAASILLLTLLSQDFLAFQLVINVLIIIATVLAVANFIRHLLTYRMTPHLMS